VEALKRY